ncbi:MAG: hypothetical protein WC323_02565 [Patescibacteria group bacterium]|jgi:hypothetical protein
MAQWYSMRDMTMDQLQAFAVAQSFLGRVVYFWKESLDKDLFVVVDEGGEMDEKYSHKKSMVNMLDKAVESGIFAGIHEVLHEIQLNRLGAVA